MAVYPLVTHHEAYLLAHRACLGLHHQASVSSTNWMTSADSRAGRTGPSVGGVLMRIVWLVALRPGVTTQLPVEGGAMNANGACGGKDGHPLCAKHR